jgi:hypothetical protein
VKLIDFPDLAFLKNRRGDIIFTSKKIFWVITNDSNEPKLVSEWLDADVKVIKKVSKQIIKRTKRYLKIDLYYKYIDNLDYIEALAKLKEYEKETLQNS